METLEKVKEVASQAASKLGLKVYNVYFSEEEGQKVLHIEVDHKGGISLNEIEQFTDEVNPLIDTVEGLDFSYSLDCSSPGAERLVRIEDISDYLDEFMEVTTNDKKFLGALSEITEESIILKGFVKGRPHKDEVKKSDIKKIQLKIKI